MAAERRQRGVPVTRLTEEDFASVLVLPKDGLGTGLAELSKRAPKTAAWLKEMSEMLNFFATEPYNEAEVMV